MEPLRRFHLMAESVSFKLIEGAACPAKSPRLGFGSLQDRLASDWQLLKVADQPRPVDSQSRFRHFCVLNILVFIRKLRARAVNAQ